MAAPLHIAHCVHALEVGGLERIVIDLTRVACRQGHRVSVVCIERRGQLAGLAEAAGAQVLCLEKPPGLKTSFAATATRALADLRPDVVHTHYVGAAWYLGKSAHQLGIPVLHTEHIDNVTKAVGWWAKLKTRLMLRSAARHIDLFCCVSDDVARTARKWGNVPGAKVRVVLNGIDTARYEVAEARAEAQAKIGLPPGAVVVGTVGRLNEVKRQDVLIRAVARLGGEWGAVHVLVVGDGPERAALERLAAELGLRERVHFAGYQSAPELFLRAMDLFALTSRLEGLPLALLEAMAAGLPVVSSAVGGVPTVVTDGETGLLVPFGDVEALAATVRGLLTDRGKAARMAATGRQVARDRYSLERMMTEYERQYRELLARPEFGARR